MFEMYGGKDDKEKKLGKNKASEIMNGLKSFTELHNRTKENKVEKNTVKGDTGKVIKLAGYLNKGR
ncbi:hypothetical protein [Niameybacter massiliensis]|uniref:hypothetical protein n=1 Tax=Niameybacter massiliensis TaxID=1658108 RepID=UPI0006B540B2|nr:hypothetical protein [Niameybacter massiliensis]